MSNVRLSTIRGTSVAASCCAHLLQVAGFRVCRAESQRPRIPAILVSEAAQLLLRDVYGRPDLFDGLFRIDRRIVSWEPGSPPVTLPHRAVAISEQALLELLRPGPEESAPDETVDWTVYTSRPLPASVEQHRFGSRTASPKLTWIRVPLNTPLRGRRA